MSTLPGVNNYKEVKKGCTLKLRIVIFCLTDFLYSYVIRPGGYFVDGTFQSHYYTNEWYH